MTEDSKPLSSKEVTEEINALEAALAATPTSAETVRATIEQELIEKRNIAIDLKPIGSRVDSRSWPDARIVKNPTKKHFNLPTKPQRKQMQDLAALEADLSAKQGSSTS